MIFTIRRCMFGFACITTSDTALAGVQLGETSEQALFNALTRFDKISQGKKELNIGKMKDIYLSNTINKLSQDVLKVINGEKQGSDLFDINNLYFSYKTSSWIQRQVWTAIWQLKPNEFISYKELAIRIKKPKAIRAVANACGQNPFAVIIPCHKILKSNNEIGQYRWGNEIKKLLLEREGYTGTL